MSARISPPSQLTTTTLQLSSHYPAIPTPVDVPLTVLPTSVCPYRDERIAQLRAFSASRMDGDIYHDFMDAGFRRSGRMIYQPICSGCRRCTAIRVPVERFKMSKSQRRVCRRNADLTVTVARPTLTEEKYRLYGAYLARRHDGKQDESREGLSSFLYQSPVDTIEFEYRRPDRALAAVGVCDASNRSLSSVYFYFDPAESRRGLGNFGVLQEIDFCRRHGIAHLYLGYWVFDAPAMSYKTRYLPYELLCTDGVWRAPAEATC